MSVDLPTPVPASLSPSRAADFKTCPLLYRYRSIDRIPEQPTLEQARGTLVHAVLERLFDFSASERTKQQALALVPGQWTRVLAERPELTLLFDETQADEREQFLSSAAGLLEGYFSVEDPSRLEPADRECLVEAVLTLDNDAAAGNDSPPAQLLLRGYIDRLDISPAGDLRVVDYKTGGAPREAFETRALFQLKFYALVLLRTRGVAPKVLRLVYLKDAEACDYTPDVAELDRFERTIVALWRAIQQATEARDFRPKPSRLCDWCAHQSRCPAYGGTVLPFPSVAATPTAS